MGAVVTGVAHVLPDRRPGKRVTVEALARVVRGAQECLAHARALPAAAGNRAQGDTIGHVAPVLSRVVLTRSGGEVRFTVRAFTF